MSGKEMLHIRRDPRTLYLALGMPVLMLTLFGYGVRFEIEHLPLALVDADHTAVSRELVQAFVSNGEFESVVSLSAPEQAEAEFRAQRVGAALVIPRGFEQDVIAKRDTNVQLLVDGADGVVANQMLTKSDAVLRAFSRTLLPLHLQQIEPPLQVKVWTRYNPSGASAIYMVPGLAAYLMAISAVLLTALTVAGEWERGSMEQLFASPVGRLEIVLGKLLPYLALGLVELLVVVAFGMIAFGVPFRGSPIALFAIGFFFLVGMLGQGLVISVITKNQLVATQAGALSALLPSMLLSGMLFPIENMPAPLQAASHAIPARYLVHALRGVLLKGNGLEVLWPDLLAQVIFAVAIIAVATARFPRRLA
jgi:ABC-2 type transport system permease protein